MSTVLNVLLIRFGIIVGIVILAALALFAVAVALKRRGRGDTVRRHADRIRRQAGPIAAELARNASRDRRSGSGIAGAAFRAAGRRLSDPGSPRERDGDRR